jgi:hypothetical protein
VVKSLEQNKADEVPCTFNLSPVPEPLTGGKIETKGVGLRTRLLPLAPSGGGLSACFLNESTIEPWADFVFGFNFVFAVRASVVVFEGEMTAGAAPESSTADPDPTRPVLAFVLEAALILATLHGFGLYTTVSPRNDRSKSFSSCASASSFVVSFEFTSESESESGSWRACAVRRLNVHSNEVIAVREQLEVY